ncbi:hypothetical protein C8R44DRAFT_872274 [Mycena epipterygia]|nr:hypothetical protein C8R44DRAFT_872274 [Mycena epipterygia]
MSVILDGSTIRVSALPRPLPSPTLTAHPPLSSSPTLAPLDVDHEDLAAVPAVFIRHRLRAKSAQTQMLALAPSRPRTSPAPSRARTSRNTSSSPSVRPPCPPPARPRTPRTRSQSRRRARTSAARTQSYPCTPSCSPLVAFPRLPRPAPAHSHSSVSLPVLPLPLPSPQSFAILHGFMYTHCLAPAFAALFPFPPAFLASLERPSNHRAPHPRHLHGASVGNLTALMGHADHAKELWQDMVALGLYDAPLCDALDLAWEVVLGALNLAAAQ